MEKKSNYQGVKLPGHPVRTRQAHGGRSIPRFAGLTALSMSNGFPRHAVASGMRAKEVSLIWCPWTPPTRRGPGARSGQKYGFFDEKIGDAPYSFLSPFSAIL